MPKIQKRRNVKNLMSKSINVFNGRKALDEVTYTESPLEADLCYHFEFDSQVQSYQAQPLSFEYFFEGNSHTYSPDFEVTYKDGSISYIEVKFIADIHRINNFKEWEVAVREGALKQEKNFIVLKEDFIRQQPLFENLINLWSAINIKIKPEFLIHLINLLDEKKAIQISEAITDYNSDDEFEQIYRLIFEQNLLAPLTKEILSKSSIIQHSGKSYDCFL